MRFNNWKAIGIDLIFYPLMVALIVFVISSCYYTHWINRGISKGWTTGNTERK